MLRNLINYNYWSNKYIILTWYVENLLLSSVNIEDIDHIENQFKAQFDVVELGRLKLYLGFVLHLNLDACAPLHWKVITKI